jgi:hypothetical protein
MYTYVYDTHKCLQKIKENQNRQSQCIRNSCYTFSKNNKQKYVTPIYSEKKVTPKRV